MGEPADPDVVPFVPTTRPRRRIAVAVAAVVVVSAIAFPLAMTSSDSTSPMLAALQGAEATAAETRPGGLGAFSVSLSRVLVSTVRRPTVVAPFVRRYTPLGDGAYLVRNGPEALPRSLHGGPMVMREALKAAIESLRRPMSWKVSAGSYLESGRPDAPVPIPAPDAIRHRLLRLADARLAPGQGVGQRYTDPLVDYVQDLLEAPGLSSSARAAVFAGLQQVRRISVSTDARDALGRRGVSIGRDWTDGVGTTRTVLVFDPATTRILSSTTWVVEDSAAGSYGERFRLGDVIDQAIYRYER